MHTSDALSRLHNLMDTPKNKDVIPLSIEHAHSHWIENLYAHKTKEYNTAKVKRKCSTPPKPKLDQDSIPKTAANTHTT